MDGDTVLVRVLHQKNAKRGADGQIIKITKRSVTETVGSYQSLSSGAIKAYPVVKANLQAIKARFNSTMIKSQILCTSSNLCRKYKKVTLSASK